MQHFIQPWKVAKHHILIYTNHNSYRQRWIYLFLKCSLSCWSNFGLFIALLSPGLWQHHQLGTSGGRGLFQGLQGFPAHRFLELQEPDAFLFDETYTKEDREKIFWGEKCSCLKTGKKQTLGDWVSLSAGDVFFGSDYRLIRSWVWLIKLIQDSLVDQVDPRSTLFACSDVVLVLPVTVCCWVQHDWLILWRPGPIKWVEQWILGKSQPHHAAPQWVSKQSWHSSHLLQ